MLKNVKYIVKNKTKINNIINDNFVSSFVSSVLNVITLITEPIFIFIYKHKDRIVINNTMNFKINIVLNCFMRMKLKIQEYQQNTYGDSSISLFY